MKYQKKCEHCGHAEVAYTYVLNKSLINALRQLVDFYESNKKAAALKDLNLTNSQYGNFAHLQYFGLTKPTPEGWYPSNDGIAFIYGDAPTVMPVAVMKGQVLHYDHEAWATHEGKPREYFVRDINEDAYKKRPEYAAEKSTASSLFDPRA
jgi:hypothetical protein